MAAHVGSRLSRVAAAGAILLGLLLVLSRAGGPSPAAAARKDGAAASGAEKGVEKAEKLNKAGKAEKSGKAQDKGTGPSDESEEPPMIDPLSVNAACYVCHMTFVGEELSTVHFQEKTTCIDCHGLSAPHANDENIGETPPDIVFKRHEVDASCEECHEEHDAPGIKVVARFLERKLADPRPICTDCHGMHKIEQPEEADEDDQGEVTLRQPRPTTQKPATVTAK